jgi:hypothetical protein
VAPYNQLEMPIAVRRAQQPSNPLPVFTGAMACTPLYKSTVKDFHEFLCGIGLREKLTVVDEPVIDNARAVAGCVDALPL